MSGQTIYVVQKGIYSGRHIVGVTTDRQRAEDIKKFHTPKEGEYGYEPEIEEFEDGAIDGLLYHGKTAYIVWLNNDGSFDKMHEMDEFDIEYFTGPSFEEFKLRDMPKPMYLCRCIAADKATAKKAAYDAYAKFKAEQIGL